MKLGISINGGGALGVGPLKFMADYEKATGFDFSKADAFAGTSTGSIVAAMLAQGHSATEIHELYRANVKRIFTKYSAFKRLKPSCPTYDNSNLKKLLNAHLHGRMEDSRKPLFITTTAMNAASQEKVWDMCDGVDVPQAVLTSCSAPTYFDTVKINSVSYCDGGMWANDPVMTLVTGLKRFSDLDDYKILTFNTGMETSHVEDGGNKSLIDWAKYIMNDWVARAGNANYMEARMIVGGDRIMRISPYSKKKYKMDCTDSKDLDAVESIWTTYLNENLNAFKNFMSL